MENSFKLRQIEEKAMRTDYTKLIGFLAALSVLSGCAMFSSQGESRLDRNWGTSFETAKQNQILNPAAGKNLEPVVGFDGRAATGSMESYRQRFGVEKSGAAEADKGAGKK
jgi:hypothetical protein